MAKRLRTFKEAGLKSFFKGNAEQENADEADRDQSQSRPWA
jgi:hypothetical protein